MSSPQLSITHSHQFNNIHLSSSIFLWKTTFLWSFGVHLELWHFLKDPVTTIKGCRAAKMAFWFWPPKGEHLSFSPTFLQFANTWSNTYIRVWYVWIDNLKFLTNVIFLIWVTIHEKNYLKNCKKYPLILQQFDWQLLMTFGS